MSLTIERKTPWKANKFRAQAVVDPEFGRFHSKREHQRWHLLRLREKAGEIKDLNRQVPYTFNVNGVVVGKIVMDFTYLERRPIGTKLAPERWDHIDEDCKGYQTDLSKLQHRLFEAIFGRRIRLS